MRWDPFEFEELNKEETSKASSFWKIIKNSYRFFWGFPYPATNTNNTIRLGFVDYLTVGLSLLFISLGRYLVTNAKPFSRFVGEMLIGFAAIFRSALSAALTLITTPFITLVQLLTPALQFILEGLKKISWNPFSALSFWEECRDSSWWERMQDSFSVMSSEHSAEKIRLGVLDYLTLGVLRLIFQTVLWGEKGIDAMLAEKSHWRYLTIPLALLFSAPLMALGLVTTIVEGLLAAILTAAVSPLVLVTHLALSPFAEKYEDDSSLSTLDLFATLGITREAYLKDKKLAASAFNKQVLKVHPDKVRERAAQKGHSYSESRVHSRWHRLLRAREVLTDDNKADLYLRYGLSN